MSLLSSQLTKISLPKGARFLLLFFSCFALSVAESKEKLFEVELFSVKCETSIDRVLVYELQTGNKTRVLFAVEIADVYKDGASFTVESTFIPHNPSFLAISAKANSKRFDVFNHSLNLPELNGFQREQWKSENFSATMLLRRGVDREVVLKVSSLRKLDFDARYRDQKTKVVDISKAQRDFEELLENSNKEVVSEGELASWGHERRKKWFEKQKLAEEKAMKKNEREFQSRFAYNREVIGEVRPDLNSKQEIVDKQELNTPKANFDEKVVVDESNTASLEKTTLTSTQEDRLPYVWGVVGILVAVVTIILVIKKK